MDLEIVIFTTVFALLGFSLVLRPKPSGGTAPRRLREAEALGAVFPQFLLNPSAPVARC